MIELMFLKELMLIRQVNQSCPALSFWGLIYREKPGK